MSHRRSTGVANLGAPHRVLLLVLVAAALAAGALIGLTWVAGAHDVLVRLVHPRWVWLGVAVAGEVVAYLGYTAAYREVARAGDGAELDVPRVAAIVSAGFGVFVHGGGFALDRAALQRAGLSESEARRRVRSLGALEYAVLAPAALIAGVVILIQQQSISRSLTLPWIIGVPVGAAIALAALHFKAAVSRWRYIGRPLERGLRSLELVLSLIGSPRRHGLALVGTLAYWAGDIFCLWATLHAFQAYTPPVAQLILAYATGYALTRRALPLGGAGIVETLLPLSLHWLKIALAPALAAVFAYRLINLWLPIIPALAGLPTLRQLERSRPRRRASRRSRAHRFPPVGPSSQPRVLRG
jgi:uncharacterized membrane protein YbhN (UPF0104 family)